MHDYGDVIVPLVEHSDVSQVQLNGQTSLIDRGPVEVNTVEPGDSTGAEGGIDGSPKTTGIGVRLQESRPSDRYEALYSGCHKLRTRQCKLHPTRKQLFSSLEAVCPCLIFHLHLAARIGNSDARVFF